LLGGFSVTVNGRPIDDRGRLRKAKTLVKLLALAPGHRLHRNTVVDRLWPDTDPEAAANNLHQIVYTIRHMMGAESITLSEDVVRLCPAGGLCVDVDVFEHTAATARRTGDLTALHRALQLWTGPLPDLCCLGYPEQALAARNQGLTQAHALTHPFSLAYALTWDAMLQGEIGNIDSQLQSAEAAIALGEEHHLRFWSSWGTVLRGWALAEAGQPELGLAELQRGEEQMRLIRGFFLQPFVSFLIAEQLAKIGQIDQGLELVNGALASTAHDQYWCDAELERLRGELLLAKGVDAQQAETAFHRAIQIAKKQQAKLFELRATTRLAQLWLKQGKSTESRELLTQAYGWFTEGLETLDLKNAQALLEN
jgi:hypothetical protein